MNIKLTNLESIKLNNNNIFSINKKKYDLIDYVINYRKNTNFIFKKYCNNCYDLLKYDFDIDKLINIDRLLQNISNILNINKDSPGLAPFGLDFYNIINNYNNLLVITNRPGTVIKYMNNYVKKSMLIDVILTYHTEISELPKKDKDEIYLDIKNKKNINNVYTDFDEKSLIKFINNINNINNKYDSILYQ